VLRGFDWVSWRRSQDAQALRSDITALTRQDRFSEGTLLNAFRGGVILGIVRRAAAIVEEEGRQLQS
jgi:hypothetical protein